MTKKEALLLAAQSASEFLKGFSKDYARSADPGLKNRAIEASQHAAALLQVAKHLARE